MKNSKNLLLAILALILVSSCSDDDSNGNANFTSADLIALNDTVNDGTWRVTQFIDDGNNETSDFNGAVFTFNSDGTIDVEMDMNAFSGTWSIELDDDDFDDDDDMDELEFDILFSNSNNFDDLSDDWYVIEYSNNRIRLSDDDDDDDDDDDFLTFERIQ